jgi:ESCRT-II complex subunit
VTLGNAEWENGPSHKILRIILKAPEVLANEIYAWASLNVLIGSVATIYELYAGEDKDTGRRQLIFATKNLCSDFHLHNLKIASIVETIIEIYSYSSLRNISNSNHILHY